MESFDNALKRITDKIEEAEAGRLRWNSAKESCNYYKDACSRIKSAHKHEIEHMGKAEYHRGHTDGIKARDASMWRLEREREEAVRKLREYDVDLHILKVEIYIALGLGLDASNEDLCDRLIHLLGGDQPTLSDLYGIWQDGEKSESMGSESAHKMTKSAEICELDVNGTITERKILQRRIDLLKAEVQQLTDQLKSATEDAKPMTDENMAEAGWIRLPQDKNGEYIFVGDVMDCGEHFGIQEVEGFIHGAVAFTVCDPQPARICTCPAHMTYHHHEPTVEQVIHDLTLGKITESQAVERIEALHGC